MDNPGIQVRKCVRAGCGLRYPLLVGEKSGERCPACGASTRLVLERSIRREFDGEINASQTLHIEAMLDNIRSAWNVGSMFRSADGAGIRHIHLCGVTPTPENLKVLKTSLGAELRVRWTHYMDGLQAASKLKEGGMQLWALEYEPNAESLLDQPALPTDVPILLVVGNEIAGVDPGILALCERVVYLPMLGVKRSYNAAVAFGIAAHYLRFALV